MEGRRHRGSARGHSSAGRRRGTVASWNKRYRDLDGGDVWVAFGSVGFDFGGDESTAVWDEGGGCDTIVIGQLVHPGERVLFNPHFCWRCERRKLCQNFALYFI